MTGFSSRIYGWLNRSPLGPTLSGLPCPVRFHDGRLRLAHFAAWRLHRVWQSHPSFQEESRVVYEAYEHGDVIDVGAFEGWYSVLLAPKLAESTVISCEPDHTAYAELQTTLALLGRVFERATFVPLPLPLGDGNPVSVSHLEGAHPRFARDPEGGAPAPTIDRLVSTFGVEPALIKIDVEGAEPFVLRGMEETLRSHRPIVMLELHPRWLPGDTSPAEVESFLADRGYVRQPISADELATRTLWRP
jgi:FkbM family methyltransferase